MLTIRNFWRADDVALPRTLPFHDAMAARTDAIYKLHVIGQLDDLDRPYILRPELWAPKVGPEVWILRGWNHPTINVAALIAHMRRIPLLMWAERPGYTYNIKEMKGMIRAAARDILLPILFLPYRYNTTLLGTGWKAEDKFCKLVGRSSPSGIFPYPDYMADELLVLPLRPAAPLPLMLYVGSFIHRKGIDLIISACEQAWDSGAVFRMRYVGSGLCIDDLIAHQLRYPDLVRIYSFATGEDLTGHYSDADGVVLYSRHDGWGLTIHEGLARGVPVLTNSACGASDLVHTSGCGIVTGSPSVQLLADALLWWASLTPTVYHTLSCAGRSLAQTITIPMLTTKLMAFCQSALGD